MDTLAPFDPFMPEVHGDPYVTYARFRDADPVHFSPVRRSWFVFRYADVVAGFKDPALSSERSKATKFQGERSANRSIGSDPPEHTPVRATITQSLYPMIPLVGRRMDDLVDTMLARLEAGVERFVDERLAGRREIDLIEDFAYPLPITVIADLFGVPEADREQFGEWSHAVARSMDRFYSRPVGRDPWADFADYFRGIVAERKADPGDDLVSRMLASTWHDERLTDEEIVNLCVVLIFAGHETTVNLIGNGMRALLLDQTGQRERFAADPASIAQSAVEEFLRFDSPAQLISRAVIEPTDLGGQELAVGDAVVFVLGSANRDEGEFGPTAPSLDIARTPNYHVAFGLGTHFCPGAKLTRVEARVAIPALLRRFPNLRLGSDAGTWRETAVLRGLEHLPVRLD